MALLKEEKTAVIKEFRRGEKDTGSPEVQIAILSKRIEGLTGHFKMHKKDNHSRRSLIAMVNNRRKLLKYVKNEEFSRYKKIIEALGIRK